MQQSYFKSAYVRRSISINLKDLHNFTTNKINSTWHRHSCIRNGLRAPVSIIYDTYSYLKYVINTFMDFNISPDYLYIFFIWLGFYAFFKRVSLIRRQRALWCEENWTAPRGRCETFSPSQRGRQHELSAAETYPPVKFQWTITGGYIYLCNYLLFCLCISMYTSRLLQLTNDITNNKSCSAACSSDRQVMEVSQCLLKGLF